METFREMRNRIFVVVLAAVMLVPVYGATVTVNGVKYTTRGNTEVSCCIADSRDKGLAELEVVEQVLIDGLPYSVTSVEGRGFKGAKYVKSVKLPNSVKRIGMNAFEGCENLESIVCLTRQGLIFRWRIMGSVGTGRLRVVLSCAR